MLRIGGEWVGLEVGAVGFGMGETFRDRVALLEVRFGGVVLEEKDFGTVDFRRTVGRLRPALGLGRAILV